MQGRTHTSCIHKMTSLMHNNKAEPNPMPVNNLHHLGSMQKIIDFPLFYYFDELPGILKTF